MVTIMEGQQEGAEVNIGLAAASLISIVVGAAGVVWLRRGRQPGAKGKKVVEKKMGMKVEEEKMVKKVEEEKDEEFKEIQLMLQESLNGNISSRLESTKSEMRVKRLELERRVAVVRREEEEELEMLEEKHRKEREEVKLRWAFFQNNQIFSKRDISIALPPYQIPERCGRVVRRLQAGA